VLNPDARDIGSGPLLVLMDGGWASAPDWRKRQVWLEGALNSASRDGRPVALVSMTQAVPSEGALTFRDADAAVERLALMEPRSYGPDRAGYADWISSQDVDDFDTIWVHDGLEPDALRPAVLEEGVLKITAIRSGGLSGPVTVNVFGPDPAGIERVLASSDGFFEDQATEAELLLDLPLELRNRVTRLELSQGLSAGGVVLADDGLRRRKVGLIQGGGEDEGQQLVRPLHYLRKALLPTAELVEAPLSDVLNTAPDMIILADVGTLAPAEQSALIEWVEDGGLLLRFAGPRLAQSGAGQLDEDVLLPVRLRAGGRSVGGAMSWGDPKSLRPFGEDSPFFGLQLPGDVNVTSQVMAQPDPDLPDRVMAALEDGTPLVTGRAQGLGRVVLFHVTANAEWSSLPLSGLFVQMLERIAILSGQTIGDVADMEGTQWVAERVLTGFGRLEDAQAMPGIDGSILAGDKRDSASPPGIYVSGDRRAAVNRSAGVTAALLAGMALPQASEAQEDGGLYAANNTVLAYVQTGDTGLDAISEAGMSGLSQVLNARTAIEPVAPVALNLCVPALRWNDPF